MLLPSHSTELEGGRSGGGTEGSHPPTVLASASPPPKQGPWLQLNREVVTSADDGQGVPRTSMSEREMELIMLGGADP